MNEWISVDDYLPEEPVVERPCTNRVFWSREVAVTDGEHLWVSRYSPFRCEWSGNSMGHYGQITHWQELRLPTLRKEVKYGLSLESR